MLHKNRINLYYLHGNCSINSLQ